MESVSHLTCGGRFRELGRLAQEVAMGEQHDHDAEVHGHEHSHVTHYLDDGKEWTHLTATHQHGHNHAAVSHSHEPHEDPAKEHGREAHIHDHEEPTSSPA
jgi:hypothetical protein